MSIMCCIYVPEGIVMAADSRLIRVRKKQSSEQTINKADGQLLNIIREEISPLTDNAQKILLIKKCGVGVSYCGNAMADEHVMSAHIQNLQNNIADKNKTWAVANKLAIQQEMQNTHFFVCGYEDNIPYVYDVQYKKVRRLNIVDTNNVGSKIQYGVTWAGQGSVISKIIKNDPQLKINWKLMPLKDAIDFGEFLIDLTIKYERFNDSIQTCGGAIDILVFTEDRCFWKQHKIDCSL